MCYSWSELVEHKKPERWQAAMIALGCVAEDADFQPGGPHALRQAPSPKVRSQGAEEAAVIRLMQLASGAAGMTLLSRLPR